MGNEGTATDDNALYIGKLRKGRTRHSNKLFM